VLAIANLGQYFIGIRVGLDNFVVATQIGVACVETDAIAIQSLQLI
jgi:hypothetical protein